MGTGGVAARPRNPGFSMAKKYSWRGVTCLLAATLAISVAAPHDVAAQQPVPDPGLLAVINGVPMTVDELHPFYRIQIRDLQQQAYEIQKRAVDEQVTQRLLTLEANRLGVTIEQLVAERIERFLSETTPEAVEAFYEKNKDDIPPIPVDEAKKQIAHMLQDARRRELLAKLVESLKSSYPVTVHLVPPRVPVTDEGESRGAEKPVVTIVLFSEFECPVCAQVNDSLTRIMGEHPDQVRVVFRHFPLDDIHPRARPAAVAATCAGKLGNFWGYHDRLMSQQDKLGPDDFVEHATEIGLDGPAFTACMNGTEAAAAVQRDVEQGGLTGVTMVPTAYVNGRPVMGRQPYETYKALVEEELVRVKGRVPTGVLPPTVKPPGE
jgi:protein-disulfide isomerase